MSNHPNINSLIELVPKYFDFLVLEYGFKAIEPFQVSYEYHMGYRSPKVEVSIWCEAGTSLPFITVKPLEANSRPTYFYVEALGRPEPLKQLYINHSSRYVPKEKRYVDAICKKGSDIDSALAELNKDYLEFGKSEVEVVLMANAELLKQHSQVLSGDFSFFPPPIENSNRPTEMTVSIRQPDGTWLTPKTS